MTPSFDATIFRRQYYVSGSIGNVHGVGSIRARSKLSSAASLYVHILVGRCWDYRLRQPLRHTFQRYKHTTTSLIAYEHLHSSMRVYQT